MTEQDTLPRKKIEKFFFDKNNFDDDHIEVEEEDAEPPPPVFSEAELEHAQKQAFERGKKEALQQAEMSREKYVSEILASISKSFSTLLQQEEQRNALFEREAVQLAAAIFQKLFPALDKAHGLEEIKTVISSVIKHQQKQTEIVIDVQDGYADDIEQAISTLVANTLHPGNINIREHENFGPSDCHLSWEDGGAKRRVSEITQEIEKHLQQTLADKASVADNSTRDNPVASDTIEDDATKSQHSETESKDDQADSRNQP